MATSDHVLISVPYKWPKGNKNHVHDPVDVKKVIDWFGREPDYRIIVREPLFSRPQGRRLIAYFNLSAEPTKDERTLRDNISRLWS